LISCRRYIDYWKDLYSFHPILAAMSPELRDLFAIASIFILMLFSLTLAPAAKETVVITGSTTVLPAVESCAEVFNSAQDDIIVQVSGGGTGRGVQDVATGLADIGMASRDVKADEVREFGDRFEEYLIGYDAICIVVSDDIYEAGVRDLSTEEIAKIYNGETNNWKELGGPDREILCVSRMAGSGTRDTFSEVILGSASAFDDGVDLYAVENAEVKTIIKQSKGAIGYLSMQYALSGVHVLKLDGIAPDLNNIIDRSYKLARPLLLLTWGSPEAKGAKFISFVLGAEGQKVIEDEGFVGVGPLRFKVMSGEL
jgi:phosphate transport system substrate-binding protein